MPLMFAVGGCRASRAALLWPAGCGCLVLFVVVFAIRPNLFFQRRHEYLLRNRTLSITMLASRMYPFLGL